MMLIAYAGTANIQEYQFTGRNALWVPNQQSDVPDDIAARLLAPAGKEAGFIAGPVEMVNGRVQPDVTQDTASGSLAANGASVSGAGNPAAIAASALPGGRVPVPDESFLVKEGAVLDFSGLRQTATPAGGRGRISVSGLKLVEQGQEVRFHVASWAPDLTYAPIPSDKAQIAAAAVNLARQGYNGIRIHGIENWLMAGVDGAATFNAARLDLFDYFFAECKRQGIFINLNVMSYNAFEDMDGANNRFTYTEASNAKPRMYTEAGVRANWLAGITALLNRTNAYTGTNMLQDPALAFLSLYNEQSTTFCASVAFPSVWVTRTPGQAAAAQTWGEWLADATKAHGYANLAALNASWGTAHASFAAAAAAPVEPHSTAMTTARKNVDVVLYMQYLEDDLAAWYSAQIASLGYPGITWWSECYHTSIEARGYGKHAINQVAAPHTYTTVVSNGIADGSQQKAGSNGPISDFLNALLMPNLLNNNKPLVCAEYGWPAWSKHMAQFVVLAAIARTHDAQYMTHFAQGDVFAPAYYNDTSNHGQRLRRIEPYHNPGNPTQDFVRYALAAMVLRGDVTPMDNTKRKSIVFNQRYYGTNPVNAARIVRAPFTLLQPLYFIAALRRAGLDWTDDTTSDDLAVNQNPKQLSALCTEAIADVAIAADHPTAQSVAINSGNIASIALSGNVGGLTATNAAPVLGLTGNTLKVGDELYISNLTGDAGVWPGTGGRNTPLKVTAKGTGIYVQVALNLAAAAGNMTAGTWSEGLNVMATGNREVFWRRGEYYGVQAPYAAPKTVMVSNLAASLPLTVGPVRVDALTADGSLLLTSLDGLPLTQSRKILVALAGDSQNSGMAFTDSTRMTIAAGGGGDYPIQASDVEATFRISRTVYGRPRITPLNRDGSTKGGATACLVESTAFVASVRSGAAQAWQWVIEV